MLEKPLRELREDGLENVSLDSMLATLEHAREVAKDTPTDLARHEAQLGQR